MEIMEPQIEKYSSLPDSTEVTSHMPDSKGSKLNSAPLTARDIDRIIEMAWEDRTPFDAITYQFGLTESGIRQLMKEELRFGSYKLWRKRVESCNTKHVKTRPETIERFKCSRQRTISHNKISKRR